MGHTSHLYLNFPGFVTLIAVLPLTFINRTGHLKVGIAVAEENTKTEPEKRRIKLLAGGLLALVLLGAGLATYLLTLYYPHTAFSVEDIVLTHPLHSPAVINMSLRNSSPDALVNLSILIGSEKVDGEMLSAPLPPSQTVTISKVLAQTYVPGQQYPTTVSAVFANGHNEVVVLSLTCGGPLFRGDVAVLSADLHKNGEAWLNYDVQNTGELAMSEVAISVQGSYAVFHRYNPPLSAGTIISDRQSLNASNYFVGSLYNLTVIALYSDGTSSNVTISLRCVP